MPPDSVPTPLEPTDFESPTPRGKRPKDPGQYVCRWQPFSLVTLASSVLLAGGGYLSIDGRDVTLVATYMLICAFTGLIMTMAATAWGAMISLTESGACGALFVMLPPYMFYYAATRWRWMSQPAVLFLCGIGLAIIAILAGQHQLAKLANPAIP